MNELSQEARALIDSVSGLDDPSQADRRRLRQRLSTELGVAAFAGVSVPVAAGGAGRAAEAELASVPPRVLAKKGWWWTHAGKLLAAASLVAGAAFVLLMSDAAPTREAVRPPNTSVDETPPSAAPQAVESPPKAAPAEPEPIATPGVDEAPAATPPAVHVKRKAPRAADKPSDTLGLELQLLGEAQAALRAGDPARALALTEQHQTQFPGGVMKEERLGIAALAACTLAPSDVAKAEAFLKMAPGSPLAVRVQRVCELP